MDGNVFYQIMLAVISLLGLLLMFYGVPWIREKIGAQNMDVTLKLVNIAVAAAEQIFPKSGQGKLKYQYVVEFLRDRGITITEQELKALIEAAVYELNRAKNLFFKDLDLQPSVGTVEFTE